MLAALAISRGTMIIFSGGVCQAFVVGGRYIRAPVFAAVLRVYTPGVWQYRGDGVTCCRPRGSGVGHRIVRHFEHVGVFLACC